MSFVQTDNNITGNFSKKTTQRTAAVFAAAAMFAFAGTAQADEDTGLQSWIDGADRAVDDVMVYPSFAAKRGNSGRSIFAVTINRNGDVIDSELVETDGSHSLRSAAQRVVKRADFPALPASYVGRELKFSLRLNYAIAGSAMEARALKRGTKVSGEQVAYGKPYASRVTILSDTAD